MAKKSSKKKSKKKSSKKKSKSSSSKKSKKSSKKSKKEKPEEPEKSAADDPIVFLGVLVLFMLIVAVAAYMFSLPAAEQAEASDVLVTVNGQPITASELEFQYNLLPARFKQALSEEEVLEQMINEELVVQAAQEAGIEVTDEDVNVRVQEVLQSGGLSLSDLQQNLETFNVTMEEFEELIRKQIYIERYSESRIDIPDPTEEDLRLLYEARKEQFETPEQVTVRHVLVSTQRDDAAVIARDVIDAARAGEDFCSLVEAHSDDRGSQQTCGEYTFQRGVMVPEFEEAAFDMEPGELRLVQTVFGYHVIEKLEDVPADTQSFEEVRDQLVEQYESVEHSRQYQILLSDLRDRAVIQYRGEEIVEPEEAESSEDTEEVEEVPDTAEETVEEDTVPGDETVEECIADRATLYGTTWSTDTQREREAYPYVPFVVCDEQSEACEQAGIVAYPTWVIDGTQVLGRMSEEDLRSATGC